MTGGTTRVLRSLVAGSGLIAGAAPAGTAPPPGWTMQRSFPDPTGHTIVAADGTVTVDQATIDRGRQCARDRADPSAECRAVLAAAQAALGGVPNCEGSPVCDNRSGGIGVAGRGDLQRVTWAQTPGYRTTFPYALPQGFGGVPAVALDSKGNLWAFKRAPAGTPQLYKFGPDHRLLLTVGDAVIGHSLKAHGMAIDAGDNVWITDATRATIQQISPEGALLRTIGTQGRRGDWDETKGQRLLWQPLTLAFGPGGDIYIAEGHGNESPNDADSADPANRSGAARVIHLDRAGRFLGQWYGNNVGQGKFSMVHGIAVDPRNGDVWIGDREQYRIVVYDRDGRFLRTIQMRNLVCALAFDASGQLWMGSGQDGQFLKLSRDGTVLAAVGGGMGIAPGQFIEASYFAIDRQGSIYAGDTSVGRITKFVAPGAR